MTHYQITPANRVRQAHERGSYDKAVVNAILDEGFVAHVGFEYEDAPMVIPMFYVRDGEAVILHGSRKARIMRTLATGIPLAIAVTHLDGLVLARSAFHHSVNYRSVVIQGRAAPLAGGEKQAAMDLLMERIARGRADQARRANKKEDRATMVLRAPLEIVSAKMRAGAPKDDAEDMDLSVWAGVIPIETRFGTPLQDKENDETLPAPVC